MRSVDGSVSVPARLVPDPEKTKLLTATERQQQLERLARALDPAYRPLNRAARRAAERAARAPGGKRRTPRR